MEDTIKQFMDYGALWGFAILVVIVVWKKVLPWGDRYMTSVEKLHDSLGERMSQQGKTINSHDQTMRDAALRGCQLCRDFVASEHPNFSANANAACDEIERIIGEA